MTAAPRILSDAIPAEEIAAKLSRIGARAFQPIAFRLSQSGPMPDRLRAAPKSYRAGDLARGEEIHKGRFVLEGAALEAGGNPWIAPLPPGVRFREELESFSWLRHLGAIDRLVPAGVAEVRERARALAETWIESHTVFAQPAWAPAIVGRRMMSWLTEGALLSDGADLIWRSKFFGSLAQQARFLNSAADLAPAGLPRLTALMGVLLSCLALGDAGPRRARAARLLTEELAAQIRSDGGHISRSPAVQAGLLADLLALRDAYHQSHTPAPRALEETIRRMLAMLRLWHAGAGRLAAFNGAGLEAPEEILAILAAGAANSAVIASARDTGFERLEAGETAIIADCGGEAPLAFAEFTHNGAASFEFASGGASIVVNCGRSASSDGQARVFRTAAAHSTLSFVGAPAKPATADALAQRLAPAAIETRREDAQGGAFLEISRTIADHGRRHTRRLYLDAAGTDLRGEDKIEPAAGADAPPAQYRLRFHLHPAVGAEMREGHVELRTAGGEAWQFRCRGGELALTESIFNGPKGALSAKQIVLRGEAGVEPVAVGWAFRRVAG